MSQAINDAGLKEAMESLAKKMKLERLDFRIRESRYLVTSIPTLIEFAKNVKSELTERMHQEGKVWEIAHNVLYSEEKGETFVKDPLTREYIPLHETRPDLFQTALDEIYKTHFRDEVAAPIVHTNRI